MTAYARHKDSMKREGENMKISVVGSINMDMTVTAEKIPKKGETITGRECIIFPAEKVRIKQSLWQD